MNTEKLFYRFKHQGKTDMAELLDAALAAQGGMLRWQRLEMLRARLTVSGLVFGLKGKPDPFRNAEVVVERKRPRTIYAPFAGNGKRGVFESSRVFIETDAGEVLQEREEPRNSFAGHKRETHWDDLHLLYFTGYAIWNYLWAPFFLTLPGFEVRELEPWQDDDGTWRRLAAKFPPGFPSHCPEQVFYFDADGLLRRVDYGADILGGTPVAHYCYDHQNFSGIVLPTRRRAMLRGPDNHPQPGPVAVSIDIHGVTPG